MAFPFLGILLEVGVDATKVGESEVHARPVAHKIDDRSKSEIQALRK